MILIKQLLGLLKLLNSETGTNQIAAGVALGFILGQSPMLSLQAIAVFVLIFFFRIQMGAAFLSAAFFKLLGLALVPLYASLGEWVLTMPSLESLFTTFYNMPLIPLTRFNNTVVMGSGLLGFLLFPVIFLLTKILVSKYRKLIVERFQETKIWKMWKASAIYKLYFNYEKLYGR